MVIGNSVRTSSATRAPKKEKYTMLSALERIVEITRKSQLAEDMLNLASEAYEFIERRTGLNRMQATLFAICINFCNKTAITIGDICEHLSGNLISVLKYQSELEKFVNMGILVLGGYLDNCSMNTYAVPVHVLKGLQANKFVTEPEVNDLSLDDFFSQMENYFDLRDMKIKFEGLVLYVDRLVNANMQLDYCKRIALLGELNDNDRMLLHYFCYRLVNHNSTSISNEDFSYIYPNGSVHSRVVRELSNETHKLIQLELIEPTGEEGFASETYYRLTNHARHSLLSATDVGLAEEIQPICSKELIANTSIRERELFFSGSVDKNMEQLASLLEDDNYRGILDRLESHGMRRGFACLFYGGPGTGKTESVLQLARRTGRDIMRIDIADMRSKWVGESQKQVKAAFDRYRQAVKTAKVAPILFFNEADAILTRRTGRSETSVDKMENAMQNIFLQEIEELEGILIATTNLAKNLDSAFERRFLYKIEFERPDATCRSKMWQSMIKGIDESVAERLADRYDFSGGQIENIARKHIVHTILYGPTDQQYTTLVDYCESERLARRDRAKSRPRIGFC